MDNLDSQLNTTILSTTGNLEGMVFAGRYQILSQLGKGGMSSVYKARHTMLGKIYALKVMHPKLIADATSMIRFRQEAAAASSLSHPNIITVYDFDTPDDRPFQVIEYLEGTSLFEEIEKTKGISLERALHIWIQICAALEHAHGKGIIHRDLKPSNVMLIEQDGDRNFVKLVDFGIAKVLPQEGDAIQQLTQTGEVFGSPFYMSPEQCLGKRLDSRSDIYSMGCLMFESLHGVPPFAGSTVFETIQKHIDEMPRSVKDVVADAETAQRLDYVLCKALAKDPAQRYQKMEELRKDLESIKEGYRVSLTAAVKQRFNMLMIHSAQVLKNKPVRLIATLVSAVCLFAAVSAWALTQLVVQVPAFATQAWPLFSLEFEPGPRKSDLSVQYPIQSLLPALDAGAGYMNRHNIIQAAIRFRDLAAGNARSELYDEATTDARRLARCLNQMKGEGIEALNGNDRTRALADYVTIGDACYYATPTAENNDMALSFYKLANDQLLDAAERMRERVCMKMADVMTRQGKWAEAQQQLLLASDHNPSQFFPSSTFKIRKTGNAFEDRAIYLCKIGDVSMALKNYEQAEMAYTAAATEWNKLNDFTPYEAQAYYMLGLSEEHLGKYDFAAENFRNAVECYERVTGRNRVNLAAAWSALADCYQRRGDLRWLQASYEAHQEAAKLSHKQS